jgi:hypothetical protein
MKQLLSRSISAIGILAALIVPGSVAPESAWAQTSGDQPEAPTTVIILRHAEKAGDSGNVDLSDAGKERARFLAKVCGSSGLAALYGVTSQGADFRVRKTLKPIARPIDLEPTILLDPDSIEKVVQDI